MRRGPRTSSAEGALEKFLNAIRKRPETRKVDWKKEFAEPYKDKE